MFKTARRLISAASFAVLTALLIALAHFLPKLWFSFYPNVSAKILGFLSGISFLAPFSVWEILLGLIIVGMLAYLIACIKHHGILCWLASVLELVVFLVFIFVAFWGLNHFAPPLSERLDMRVGTYTTDQLKDATSYYLKQASAYSSQITRDDNGNAVLSDLSVLSDAAHDAYIAISDDYSIFSNPAPGVKPLLTSKAFSYIGLTGIYIAFTGEPCINSDAYGIDLPYTMCHELAHSMCIAAEDDANFCAFLACESSDEIQLRYSGYYSAFVYCYNALYKADSASATALWASASDELIHDCNHAAAYYKQYDGAVQDAADKVNDAYLKAFSEKDGTQSYGAVADYLIAYYLTLSGS